MPAELVKAQLDLAQSTGGATLFKLGGEQYLVIDYETVMKENNKAERQCQDNLTAFHQYKKQKLFPKLNREKKDEDMKDKRSKDIVKAFKEL